MDKLIVKGVSKQLDGEYGFDLTKLISPGDAEYLTYREWHKVKAISGVRAGELQDAFVSGDTDLNVALAVVVLERAGKRVDVDLIWDAPGTSEIRFVLGDRDGEEDGESLPPTSEPPVSEESERLSTSGGGSSRPTLVSPATDPSRTGDPGTATLPQATSAS
jgi:hypothetical protein